MDNKNKKLLLSLLVLVLLVSIGKETYALFTSEVSSIVQNYGTGTLKLSYSNTSINLNNAYPMTDEDGMNQSDSTITITNTGTLAYKFDVILDPSSDSTISSDLIRVSLDGENPATLSTDSNIIIRDVILNPGSSRTFTLKIWINGNTSSADILNKKFSASLTSTGIAVKDMEDSNGDVLTTPTLYNYIKRNADTTTTIDFSKSSETSNTNGIYMTTDTDSDKPVYYYRGNVDNRVIFANYCWRIVRTTETGGVKLIYDGELTPNTIDASYKIVERDKYSVTNDETWPFVYDSTNGTWKSNISDYDVDVLAKFGSFEEGYYKIEINVHDDSNYDEAYVFLDGKQVWSNSHGETSGTIFLKLTPDSVLSVENIKFSEAIDGSTYIEFSFKKAYGDFKMSCNNTGDTATIGSSRFTSSTTSPADVGYMYGTKYSYSNKFISSLSGSIVFGNDITYSNGNYTLKDTYTLSDVSNWDTEYSTIASKYHYTCFTSNVTCENVDYVAHIRYSTDSSSYFNYFELSDGKNHLDILEEMLTNSANTNDSTIKATIDAWYEKNMTNYTSQLEDTVFCNDRGYDLFLSISGWNKDYSNREDSATLYFNIYRRRSLSQPTLMCANSNDKFTVENSNGNGALKYPVGLLTADEMMYAGENGTSNSSVYLNGAELWTLTPYDFTNVHARVFYLYSNVKLSGGDVDGSHGLRPVVSLKPGVAITGGSGTAADPFVIG